ncbi:MULTISPECIES: sensor histidine kinase [Gordonia]|uniref:sensor histidine kinase n=1 Tax=Gordonia TaxID=2053 RepID=UPI00071CDA3C|nr:MULTISPECIES: sensor histidine kinase KdpD [unclassified Gordonia (in: high G+C Gram-positive bacteria)]KSU61293.1 histidine kinase [Gordonia sp. SGD-V-85]MBN0974399.1 sensor histidine kinase KdpD [Gordonia sp. BP-119]MBN0984089.1 sensor histidine kinase KdpD [Gordonia sp. BP-94]MCX2753905.1 sensor histidine kinase KdpD [Gordonia sp. 4N]SCB78103.1 two-component system, OmpR family, sensor histidine kinase KdpD [Gordonia sp. v-85]
MTSAVTGHHDGRGKLRVFLGCAPGVGKTYEMLAQARTLVDEGVDVVIGVVESHGRVATAALAEGVEVVPRTRRPYRGTPLEDMDLEAVLARRPQVVLVDELAHTNVPGLRNRKRWEDIEELLAAGFDVYSTINIQHLESLNDVVAQITGVVQRETVPDDIVRGADEIELVDIDPQALRQRLSAGKVYPNGRVDGALANYFRQGNLTALRELALLWLADQVDDKLADYRAARSITETWEARERVVVAVTGGAESPTLLRRASRIASRSSAELLAVHVVRGDGLTGAGVDLAALKELATGFGARIHTVVGDDIPDTLLDFARGVNATQLVLGTSRRPRWQRIFDEGVGAAVVSESGRIDVHMVTHDETTRRSRLDIRDTRFHRPLSWVFAVLVPAAVTGVLQLLDPWLGFASQSALYFVAVLAVSMLGGILPAALSAVISGLLLNYFFTDPRFTFTISQPDNLITILVMLLIAIAVAVLVDSATVRRAQAQDAAREAELLALFSSVVLGGADVPVLLDRFRETYDQSAVSVVRRTSRVGRTVEAAVGDSPPTTPEDADTVCVVPGDEFELLLRGPKLGARDRRVLSAVAGQAAGAVQRHALEAEAATADALARTDELRRALLSAVGHDLRTPLAAAKAAVSSLRSDDVTFSAEDTAELLATVDESVDHLTSLVGNLLDSSRLAAGAVRPQRQRTFLPEVVHRAAVTAGRPDRQPGPVFDLEHAWAYTDPGLLERALANLIDNARRHGGGQFEITARLTPADPPRCVIRVVDHGTGLPMVDRDQIFVPFHQNGDTSGASSGVGLGLSVARGFVTAIGGVLSVEDTPGGGATMVVDLPATDEDTHAETEGPTR